MSHGVLGHESWTHGVPGYASFLTLTLEDPPPSPPPSPGCRRDVIAVHGEGTQLEVEYKSFLKELGGEPGGGGGGRSPGR